MTYKQCGEQRTWRGERGEGTSGRGNGRGMNRSRAKGRTEAAVATVVVVKAEGGRGGERGKVGEGCGRRKEGWVGCVLERKGRAVGRAWDIIRERYVHASSDISNHEGGEDTSVGHN